MPTITSSNSVYMIAIANLFPIPVQIQGYATDSSFETEAVEVAEVMKGVDGILSYGYIPYMTVQTINLQADSPSFPIFEAWAQASKAAQEIYPANGIITLPGIGRKYVMSNGVLTRLVPISSSRKTLQARAFTITWDDVSPLPV